MRIEIGDHITWPDHEVARAWGAAAVAAGTGTVLDHWHDSTTGTHGYIVDLGQSASRTVTPSAAACRLAAPATGMPAAWRWIVGPNDWAGWVLHAGQDIAGYVQRENTRNELGQTVYLWMPYNGDGEQLSSRALTYMESARRTVEQHLAVAAVPVRPDRAIGVAPVPAANRVHRPGRLPVS
ncbi:hypothetical protein [Micromonospora sp. CPCC 206061]|uniref:hypothetical protein n=1 Tax=Micromonospora sp. CPCC 206061 TaxID=3122410 RepID=UPI002FF10C5C